MRTPRGFTLIELLIVSLILGILAAVATPLYLGYVREARAAEGKQLAGSLWIALQALGTTGCGRPVAVREAFGKAGLTPSGESPNHRWAVTGDGNTLRIDCETGVYILPAPLFTVQGLAEDVSFVRVRFFHDDAKSPPGHLECSTDRGEFFSRC